MVVDYTKGHAGLPVLEAKRWAGLVKLFRNGFYSLRASVRWMACELNFVSFHKCKRMAGEATGSGLYRDRSTLPKP